MPKRKPFRLSRANVSATSRRAFLPAVLAALTLFALQASAAPGAPRHTHKHLYQKQVEALEMQWRDAVVRGDAAAMDRLLSDDFVGITANGTVQTKEEALARMKERPTEIQRLDLSEVKAAIHGDTAVVTSKAEVALAPGAEQGGGTFRYTRVYLRTAGVWKIINFEATRIRPRGEKRDSPAETKP